jgi:membrane protein implicated in regulation of membrane protease activity
VTPIGLWGAALAPREEGWLWWLALVLGVVLVVLLLAVLRRRFVSPMPHKPSDTTDSWKEAGRRLQVPKAGEDPKTPGAEEESP